MSCSRLHGIAWFSVSIVLLLVVAACSLPLSWAEPESGSSPQTTETTTGSGSAYRTSVERRTQGELSEEDFQQVSLLGTRIVRHVNRASEHLLDEQHDEARSELSKAQTLATVIREMLPVTVVETVVRDSSGKEVYRSTDRVQEDQIPIFRNRIAVEVMEPILDAKKDAAAVKGLRLADADLVHTSVLLDLKYVERKIKRCVSLLEDEPGKALAQLALAQTSGVRLSLNKEDHPLVEAQSALRIAQRMAEQGRHEAANANLTLARNHLELYRGLMGKSSDERIDALDSEIAAVMKEIESPDAGEKIAGFWNRLTSWFTRESGVARIADEGEKTEAEAAVSDLAESN